MMIHRESLAKENVYGKYFAVGIKFEIKIDIPSNFN